VSAVRTARHHHVNTQLRTLPQEVKLSVYNEYVRLVRSFWTQRREQYSVFVRIHACSRLCIVLSPLPLQAVICVCIMWRPIVCGSVLQCVLLVCRTSCRFIVLQGHS